MRCDQSALFVWSSNLSIAKPLGSNLYKTMLHALYLIAFAVLSALAISNLIRNIMMFGTDARRDPRQSANKSSNRSTPHPEMLNDKGQVLDEPLLVMKSISLEDAREQLDALYDGSSNGADSAADEEA